MAAMGLCFFTTKQSTRDASATEMILNSSMAASYENWNTLRTLSKSEMTKFITIISTMTTPRMRYGAICWLASGPT